MIKIVIVIAAVVAIAAAQPRLQETRNVLSPAAIRIGQLIQRVPTAVSHQSQTVFHNQARVVNDILAPATVVRTVPAAGVYQVPNLQAYLGQPTLGEDTIYSIQK